MHQFATGRPDEKDKKVLKDFSKKILEKIENGNTSDGVQLPGNYPYREYKSVPLKHRKK